MMLHRHRLFSSPVEGFTLLELSIVLVVISLVTAMAVTSGISLVSNARQSATVQRMAAIDKALMAFRTTYDRIPCPGDLTLTPSSSNFGLEASNPGAYVSNGGCTGGTIAANFKSYDSSGKRYIAAVGALPTRTLGLPDELMYDGWGNHFRYAVDTTFTSQGSFSGSSVAAACGNITICDKAIPATNPNTTNPPACYKTPRSTNAIYVLLSHGPNGQFAYNRNGKEPNASSVDSNEIINGSSGSLGEPPLAFVQDVAYQSSTNPLNSFDDIVTYKERRHMALASDSTSGSVCANVAYVPDPFGSRVSVLDKNGGVLRYLTSNLKLPVSAAIDTSGNVWVVDQSSSSNKVVGFSSTGTALSYTIPSSPASSTKDGQLTTPSDITFDASGNAWVVDQGNHRIQEFTLSGTTWTYKLTLGGGGDCVTCLSTASSCTCNSGSTDGLFTNPTGIAIDPNGNVWVTDFSNNNVQQFSGTTGAWMRTIPSSQVAPSPAFSAPYYIAASTKGMLWIVNNGGNQVLEYDINGNPVLGFDTTYTTCGVPVVTGGTTNCLSHGGATFNSPSGIRIDPSTGNIWVQDAYNKYIDIFSSNGTYITRFSSNQTTGSQVNIAVAR